MVVQHFWCRKICHMVWRVTRTRVKSKFLYQDADVIPLADKCIIVTSLVCRNYDKVLMVTGKFSGNFRVKENGLVSGVDRAFKSSNSTLQNIGDLTHSERVSTSTSSFLAHRLAYFSHTSMMIFSPAARLFFPWHIRQLSAFNVRWHFTIFR